MNSRITSVQIATVTLLLLPLVGLADFESAVRAYKSQDYHQAFEGFASLAAAGDARSQTILAIMYKYGEGVPENPGMAGYWYRKAAEQGYPPAQYNLGAMLADGRGVEPDPIEAKVWLQKAAEAGFARASDKLAEISGDLRSGDIRSGDIRIASPGGEAVPWSRNWDLRLPDEIRFGEISRVDPTLKVYRIQLGAMSSVASAQQLWKQALRGNEHLLGGYQPIYRPGSLHGKAIWRVQIGPFSDRASAGRVCRAYLNQPDRRSDCLVILTN